MDRIWVHKLSRALPSKPAAFTVPTARSPYKVDRLLHAQGARAEWSRRRNFDSSRFGPFTSACDGEAVAVNDTVAELLWLGLGIPVAIVTVADPTSEALC